MTLANHLWLSTLFALAAWILTLALKRNRAAVRYAVWFAASVKFLVPFSILAALGHQLPHRSTPAAAAPPPIVAAIADMLIAPAVPIAAAPSPGHFFAILLTVWFAGIALGLLYWARTLLQIREIRRAAAPLDVRLPIPVLSSPAPVEPGVFGIVHPVLILPAGLADRLTPAQLDAVIAHELCHVRRRDNLTAAIHMLVETVFWFHPLVWWIRARLVAERERACDEAVFADPHTYAEAILNVCRLYLEAPACVSGVTGANLRQRIDLILANRGARRLSAGRKLLLTFAAAAAIAIPLVIGHAQPGSAVFDAASIKPAAPPEPESNNRSRIEYTPVSLTMRNVDLTRCVQWAYDVEFFQISGSASSDAYDIFAKSAAPAPVSQLRLMLQDLLAKRFQLAVHRESKVQPVYELVVAKGRPKLPTPKPEGAVHAAESLPRVEKDAFVFRDLSLPQFAAMLAKLRGVDLPVVDHTGIPGTYDLVLKSAPEAARQGDTQALFAIIEEQLGLRLTPAKAPLEMLVIDHASKPTGN